MSSNRSHRLFIRSTIIQLTSDHGILLLPVKYLLTIQNIVILRGDSITHFANEESQSTFHLIHNEFNSKTNNNRTELTTTHGGA